MIHYVIHGSRSSYLSPPTDCHPNWGAFAFSDARLERTKAGFSLQSTGVESTAAAKRRSVSSPDGARRQTAISGRVFEERVFRFQQLAARCILMTGWKMWKTVRPRFGNSDRNSKSLLLRSYARSGWNDGVVLQEGWKDFEGVELFVNQWVGFGGTSIIKARKFWPFKNSVTVHFWLGRDVSF